MNPKTSTDLFNKIRSQFSNIRIGDANGSATADPAKATFFEFEFQPDSDTFGSVSISIADGENMKVFYNRDLVEKIDEDSRDEWYAFLKELKDFAVEHSLRFDVRDITKSNLSKQDYQNMADTNQTVNTDEMSEELQRITKLAGVNEGLTGTAKRSYENLDKTRLIIRHTGSVDENVPGARSRQIQSLYIENEDGERFKYPLTHLAGARAMARHVANGGRPHDDFGQHIIQTSEDIAKLNSFSRYVTNKDQLNDNAGDIIEQTKLKLENLRSYVKNISKQSHYENATQNFKTQDEVVLDDETANSYKEKFTLKNFDSRVEEALPIIHRIMSELENAPKAKFDQYGAMVSMPEPTDKMADLNSKMKQTTLSDHLAKAANVDKTKVYFDDVDLVWGSKTVKQGALIDKEYTFADAVDELKTFADANPKAEGQVNELDPGEEPIDAPIEPPVDHGGIVQSFLTDPNSKLVLRKDASADKMLGATKFTNKNTMLSSILSDIASRMLTKSGSEDRVANFASRVADGLDQENSATFKPDADYIKNKKIAIQLAKRYIDDYKKMQKDPKYADEVRMEPGEYNPKKDIKGKAKETAEFESWVNNIDEYAKTDFESWLERNYKRGVKGLGAQEYSDMVRKYKQEKEREEKMQKAGIMKKEGMQGMTFEDIKPYVSMYQGDDGKMVYDVLDKDSKSAFKSGDAKAAMQYLSKNFDKLRNPVKESLNESRSKIVAAIKAKVDSDTAQNIAGVEEEIARITQLANYQ